MLQKKTTSVLFQNNFRMMDIIARNISSLVSSVLVMASSAAVVNLVSLLIYLRASVQLIFLLSFQ